MKKLSTLIIALMAFFMGTQNAYAEATETLVGTIKTGTVLNNPEDNNYLAFLLLWNYFHQLNMDFDEDTEDVIISNLDGKVLFTVDENQTVTLAPGVTSDDDIVYTITNKDRNSLRAEPEAYEFVAKYETIRLHFDTSGGGGNGEGGDPGITERKGTLGTQGYWTFADGVLTVTYDGAMPTLTSKTDHADDPDVAFRFKWIDFLAQIEEVVVTGKDVEVQPYFLYYEGDGPSGSHPDDHIKTVTLSDGVKRIGRGSFSLYELKRVNCYGVNAPILPATISSNYVAFWGSRITANLAFLWTVPNASTDYAQINSEWAKFNHSATKLNPLDMPTQENSADFETGKMDQVPFFSDSQYPWDVTNEDADGGSYSMKSGNKGIASSTSTISAMYLYETDGIIYFMAKCMGEGSGDGWDKCIFLIDGVQQFSYGALGNYWSNYSFPVSAGMHTFTWQYSKDSSVDPEGDGFFVDNIYFLQNGKDDDLITGVESLTPALSEGEGAWFDMSGRRLGSKPAKAGLYIYNGKKVMIK